MPAGTPKYFSYPFGVSGDLTTVPDPTQAGGSVSYNQGFGPDYALINTDPSYLSIPRNQFNQLLFDVTSTLQQIYQNGFPLFITSAMNGGSAYSYSKNAYVYQAADGNVYYSLVNSNTDVPPSVKWQVVGGSTATSYFNAATDTGTANHYVIAPVPSVVPAAGDIVILQPVHANTGACDININSAGAIAIKTITNLDPAAGMMIPSGTYLLAYNTVTGFWVLLNPTLGTAAYLNVGTSANQIVQLNGSAQLPAVSATNLTSIPIYYMQVREEQPSGTASGTFTAGAWQTRVLNTTKFNNITGASLASNQFTLPAGTYQIAATAPHYIVSVGQAKIYNVTDSADAIIGQTSANSTADAQSNWSYVRGIITISGTKVFQLQHRCFITRATNGFGPAASFGVNEVYADVIITKLY